MGTYYYANDSSSFLNLRFENDVNKYGTQAEAVDLNEERAFENDVNKYGTQASNNGYPALYRFENDVNKYGTQAAQ